MADSLFDGRYRYDYIYPRGRSGETLRAEDTADGNRPVVIKRPAPNDAPPIRAGQEVSILNERKALQRLSGQQALTALLGGGQFFVGGVPHQYIVVERAEGAIIADLVLELGARGERLPELEMLVILDRLLEVLSAAHAHDIVYNDVDAKHLFWDRENYRLKIIDWGNATFLEGDEITPQGISRQSDVFQIGELLYFILTAGGRPDIPRDAGEDFRVDFGYDAERIHSRLQAIVARALHPNPRLRYRTIDELRKDLADYRAPIERERNAILGRINERLRRDQSKDDLNSLLRTLEPALLLDPGYPPARDTERQILDKLSDLEVAADLDAARIYLESGNWNRAASLLEELRARARGSSSVLIHLLLDWSYLLNGIDLRPTPPVVVDAISQLFDSQSAINNGDTSPFAEVAYALVTDQAGGEDAVRVQWLLAERVAAHVGDVQLLRPNLYRLDVALRQLADEGVPVNEPLSVFAELQSLLDAPLSDDPVSLIGLRDRYRGLVDGLTALNTLLGAVNSAYQMPNRRLPLSSLERALNAAMALADNMHVIGKQATASPRDALGALDSSRAIDPVSPVWDRVAALLDSLYEKLGDYQVYVPTADGSDLDDWLKTAQADLQPFVDRLFDEMLVGMVKGLNSAERNWQTYAAAAIQGNRIGAITALAQATDAVGTISPTLAGWLNQLRTVVTNGHYIERHALYGGLGRALADGWEAYDRGRLADAERLGQQAYEIARNEAEQFAARRLRDLAEITRGWTERNGITDAKRTQATLTQVELLYTVDENNTRNSFTTQMPSKETYLKAMGKGLVDLYARNSTAAVRILFFNYILLGALDAHEGALDDAEFWREAAARTLTDLGAKHVATRALDDFVQRRRDLIAAAETLGAVNGRHALPTLDATRKALESNPQARALSAAIYSLRELEAAVRDWSDGEFRAAGIKLENALKALDEVETQAAITPTGYRAFLMDLIGGAAELHNTSRQMQGAIENKPETPPDILLSGHRRLVDQTVALLGDNYAGTLRQWRDTYLAFQEVYTDRTMRRSARLARFNELFRAMFIDRHPAYPLYRFWYELTDAAPEFPAPPTDEPTPRLSETEDAPPEEFAGSKYLEPPVEREDRPARRLPRLSIIGPVGLVLLVVLLLLVGGGGGTPPAGLPTDEPVESEAPATSVAAAVTEQVSVDLTEESQPSPRPTTTTEPTNAEPTPLPLLGGASPTPLTIALATTAAPAETTPTVDLLEATAVIPSETLAPTNTLPPTVTPTPRVTVPPGGVQGRQDLLALAASVNGEPWLADEFSRQTGDNAWRLGAGTATGAAPVLIEFPADLLESTYGNNAAARIRSIEATLALTTFDPALLEDNQVYFGALVANPADTSQQIGLHVQVPQPGIINLGHRQGDEVQIVSQRSVTAVVVRVRLERDPSTGAFTTFYNNEQVGQPIPFIPAGTPVLPALYVRNGGVVVSVTEWTVTLR